LQGERRTSAEHGETSSGLDTAGYGNRALGKLESDRDDVVTINRGRGARGNK